MDEAEGHCSVNLLLPLLLLRSWMEVGRMHFWLPPLLMDGEGLDSSVHLLLLLLLLRMNGKRERP